MNKENKKISAKAGLPPGSLIHIGKRKKEKAKLTGIMYNSSSILQKEINNFDDCLNFQDENSVHWINVDGLHDTELISRIGKKINLHPLLLEDVLNTDHRPKFEEYEDYLFISLKMIEINREDGNLNSEQVSLVLGNNWLLSFQEKEGDVFDLIRKRLNENKGIIRKRGADYLLYALIDAIVDNYFSVIEYLGDSLDNLEQDVLEDSSDDSLQNIQKLKRLIMHFRKSIIPLREVVLSLQKHNSELINEGTFRYLHDLYEHLIHINDNLETQREMIASIMDLYLSGVSNKMNQVMKVLTIIATIFIPLTFIAGIYGMNFENMPELHWKYGYFIVWGVMVMVTLFMINYFRKKKWL